MDNLPIRIQRQCSPKECRWFIHEDDWEDYVEFRKVRFGEPPKRKETICLSSEMEQDWNAIVGSDFEEHQVPLLFQFREEDEYEIVG